MSRAERLRLAVFAAALAALFGAALVVGGLLGDDDADGRSAQSTASTMDGHADAEADVHADEADGADHGAAAGVHDVRGLAVAADGLRLALATPELSRERAREVRFAILGPDGEPVRDFDVEHARRMHVVVVRRDLTGFQHVHPRLGADGTWRVPVRIDAPGSYRLLADFVRDGEPHTLAADLRVDGPARLRPLPPAEPVAHADGYEVALDAGDVHAGREAQLRFAIRRDGRPVEVEPYLGAAGHLVALREGDLAFLHVHPTSDDDTRFAATFPTPGAYRLFLQFRAAGRVHTAAFTLDVPA